MTDTKRKGGAKRRLSALQVAAIVTAVREGRQSQRAVAEEYGMSAMSISAIMLGRTYADITRLPYVAPKPRANSKNPEKTAKAVKNAAPKSKLKVMKKAA